MKKLYLIIIVIILLVFAGGGSFYGGILYEKNSIASKRFNQTGNFPQGAQNSNLRNRGGLTSGEIISKDDQSVTIKTRNNSSKIIFYSDATEISKFAGGDLNDVEVGKNIMVTGAANQDGSITAKTIQIGQISPIPQSGN